MKVERIDHIHVAVKDLEKAIKFFETVLGTTFSPPNSGNHNELGHELGMKAVHSPLGLELLAPSSDQSVLTPFLEKRGEGLHAISLKVDDIEAAIEHCQKCGLRLIGRVAVGKLKEAQFHPKDSFGFMLELCEYPEQSQTWLATRMQD